MRFSWNISPRLPIRGWKNDADYFLLHLIPVNPNLSKWSYAPTSPTFTRFKKRGTTLSWTHFQRDSNKTKVKLARNLWKKKSGEWAASWYLFWNLWNNGMKRISGNIAHEKWQDYRKDVYEQQQHVRVITFHALMISVKERVSFTNPSNNLFTCFFISYYPLPWKKSHSTSVKIKFFRIMLPNQPLNRGHKNRLT